MNNKENNLEHFLGVEELWWLPVTKELLNYMGAV